MFFERLKNYLKIEFCNKINNYREYLVYVYPYIVQTTVDNITYMPAFKFFYEDDGIISSLNTWDIDKVIRMTFGFNGEAITPERMESKADILEQYDFKI